MAAVATLGLATPAHADKPVTATAAVSCPGDQLMVGGKFTLTKVLATQQIAVHTLASDLPLASQSSYVGDTATYDVAFDAALKAASPATASVPNSWNGSFTLTTPTCKAPVVATTSATTSACGASPSLTLQVTNHNPVMVDYTAILTTPGTNLVNKTATVRAGQTGNLVFAVVRGKEYRLSLEGDDSTSLLTTTKIPLCVVSPPASKSPKAKPSSAAPSPVPTPAVATPEPSENVLTEPVPTYVEMNYERKAAWIPWALIIGATLVVIGGAIFVLAMRRRTDEDDDEDDDDPPPVTGRHRHR